MKKSIMKIADYGLILTIISMVLYTGIITINHVAVIKNLPVEMDPTEKEILYKSLMKASI